MVVGDGRRRIDVVVCCSSVIRRTLRPWLRTKCPLPRVAGCSDNGFDFYLGSAIFGSAFAALSEEAPSDHTGPEER
jgi:hypothetical protein